jgi:hypothetical protein
MTGVQRPSGLAELLAEAAGFVRQAPLQIFFGRFDTAPVRRHHGNSIWTFPSRNGFEAWQFNSSY